MVRPLQSAHLFEQIFMNIPTANAEGMCLCSYGPYSYDPYRYGPCTCGLYSYGPHSCQKLEPEWEKAATRLKGEVMLGAVDVCTCRMHEYAQACAQT